MLKSMFIACSLSGFVLFIMHFFVQREALFWSIALFISLFALIFTVPNKDLTKILHHRCVNNWIVGILFIWAVWLSLSQSGFVIEKIVRCFCIFISFYCIAALGAKFVRNSK